MLYKNLWNILSVTRFYLVRSDLALPKKMNTKIFYLVVAHYVQTAVQIDIYVYV